MTDFFSSDAGRFAKLAKQFLEGALTLDAAQSEKGEILFLPTLTLAGHGLELMLKSCVYLNGQTPKTKGGAGHDVVNLWRTDICEPVRRHVFINANCVADEVRSSETYLEVPEHDKIEPLIEEYVLELGKLHGDAPYPLRYPSAESQMAPTTPLLVKSLWRTSDDLVKRSPDFRMADPRRRG